MDDVDTQFAPVPIIGPRHVPVWREASLRALEALSIAVLVAFVWYCVVKRFRRTGRSHSRASS